MIHVIKDYYIKVDERNYTVCRKTSTNENGDDIFSGFSYYGNLAEALEFIQKDIIRRKLKTGVYELSDALKIVKEESRVLKDLLKDFAI